MHDPIITETTRTNYEIGWRRFTEWCDAEGRDPLDADGATVAEWLHAMSADLAPGTLRLSCAAITDFYKYRHPRGKQPDPTKTDEVRAALQHIDRANARAGRELKQATPLTLDLLEKVLRISALRRSGESIEKATRRHLEAEAVIRLMFDSALRADEMIRAEWGHVSEPAANGHRTLRVPRSKTDQTGKGRYGNVSPETWAALERWRVALERWPEAVERMADEGRSGCISTANSAPAITARFKRLGKVAGIEGLSGHSCRRGVLTTLGQHGATMSELMAVSGHRSPAMVARYVDAPHAATNAVTKLYDNGDDHPERHVNGDTVTISKTELAELEAAVADVPAFVELSMLDSQLTMAVKCGVAADHPEVVAVRARLIELWPMDEGPPADCDRPGCPGIVTVSNPRPGERYCCARCRKTETETRRRKRRKQ